MLERVKWGVRLAFGGCVAFSLLVMCFAPEATGHTLCRAMKNNVLLAYIPVELSLHLQGCRSRFAFCALGVAWMIFFPNAPYVLTDYFHLAMYDPYVILESGRRTSILRHDLHLWLTFAMLSVNAMVCALFGTWSLDNVIGALLARIKRSGFLWRALFALGFTALASAGIYLGRFPRLHSIHLITNPRHAFGQIASSIGLNLAEFIVLLTIVQMILWAWLRFYRYATDGERAP